MNIDRWIGVLGLVLGAIGIWLAYYFYRKTIRTKLLAFAYTKAMPLFVGSPEVTFTYMGSVREQVTRTFILLWNRGVSPVEETDFIAPITIQTPEALLQLSLLEKDPAANVGVDQNGRTITVRLLRPGEAALLQLDTAEPHQQLSLSVQMKSADMSTDRPFTGNIEASISIIVAVCIFAAGMAVIISAGIGDLGLVTTFIWIFTFVLASMGGSVLTFFSTISLMHRIQKRNLSPVASRFIQIEGDVARVVSDASFLKTTINDLSRGLPVSDRRKWDSPF